MAVGLLALNGNAVLRLLNDILCHYFLFVIRCHSASFGKRLSFFAILKIGNSESASSTQKELHYPAITKKVAECCYFKADKVRSAEHTLAYVSNSESASSTQKELHYPTFFSIFVVEYSGQGEIPYRR